MTALFYRVGKSLIEPAWRWKASATPNPQTSYGAQKVCCEYMTTGYTRKGFIDGRSLRLPTISVRAGDRDLDSFAGHHRVEQRKESGVAADCR